MFTDPGTDFIYDHNKLTYLFFDGSPEDIVQAEIEYGSYFNDIYTPIRLLVFNVKPGIYTINNYESDNSINSGMEHYLKAIMINQCGNLYPTPPSSIMYKAEIIDGQGLGTLYYDGNGTSGNIVENIKQYDGILDSVSFIGHFTDTIGTANITIRISSNDSSIAPIDVDYVLKPSPLIINISPPTLNPGDTANITVQFRNSDGTVHDCQPGQLFKIGILSGCVSGNFLVGGRLGTLFDSVIVPFKFIADTLESDTGTVRIRVGYDQISCKIIAKPTQNKFIKEKGKSISYWGSKYLYQSKNSNKTDIRNKTLADVCNLEFKKDIYLDQTMVVKKHYDIDISPLGDRTIDIDPNTHENKMPLVTFTANLKKYYPDNYDSNKMRWEWIYRVEKTYTRHQTDDTETPICSRKALLEFSGSSLLGHNSWTVPFNISSLTKIKITGPNFKYWDWKGEPFLNEDGKKVSGCEQIIQHYEINDSDIDKTSVFTGGNITLIVYAIYNGEKIDSITKKVGKILGGNNPKISDVKYFFIDQDRLGLHEFCAILLQESNNRYDTKPHFDQFKGEPGFPCYGPPNGFGVSQLDDPAATEKELWNWRANAIHGQQVFWEKRTGRSTTCADKFFDGTEHDGIQYLKYWFGRYNGTYYYKRIPKNKSGGKQYYFLKKNDDSQTSYGDAVYDLYTHLTEIFNKQ
ncbi:MAG: hypothetical protein P4L27_13335 [Ignavibacteriaceae bacterium]|nr:hypothetical protein [Ignavibacteriaceae bacterium]